MKNVRIVIEYDGTAYCGWQSQGKLPTVQATIERCLEKITGERTRITGAGRTDSGVHAMGQVANFSTASPLSARTLQKALNSTLPDDISVTGVGEVPADFHAQFSSRSKVYEYRILNVSHPPALMRNRVWHVAGKLDLAGMKEAAEHVVGTRDFSVFASANITVRSTVRTVRRVSLRKNREGVVLFEIEADGFLKRMVRMITGTLVETGKGKIGPGQFAEILRSGRKTKNVVTAPSQGLFLKKVVY